MAKPSSVLLNLSNISPRRIQDIINNCPDCDELFKKGTSILSGVPLLDKNDIDKLCQLIKSEAVNKELKLAEKENIKIIDIFDAEYPLLLKQIPQPPPVLYVKGDISVLNGFIFAIVGTRLATIYGAAMAEEFAYKLSSLGMAIVSGFARGIDTAAHKGALRGGATIAVLGSGLLNLYPKENAKLADKVIEKGALVSEFSLNASPLKENFPRRNRIVSGLSKGVLVVEAAAKSGALITAHCALEQNREVFALPGKADSPFSKGCHLLIKDGAKLVDSIEDILCELNIDLKCEEQAPLTFNIAPQAREVFDSIGREGISLEEIFSKCKIQAALLNKIILDLQLKGLIKEAAPSYFVKA